MKPVLLLATLVCVMLAAGNLQQRLNYELPDDGVVWTAGSGGLKALRVAPDGPGEKAGVEPGDLLRRIDGVAVRQPSELAQLLFEGGAWRTTLYTIDHPTPDAGADGGAAAGAAAGIRYVEVERSVVIGAATINTPMYAFLWLVALCYLAIGLTVLLRHRRRPMVLPFYVFCLASFVLYAFSYSGKLDALDRWIYWGDVWATVLAPAIFLHFCLSFGRSGRTSSPGRIFTGRVLRASVYLPAAAVIAIYHGAAAGWLETALPAAELSFLLDRVSYALLGSCFVGGALYLNFAAPNSEDLVSRRQRRWLAAGTLWGVFPFAACYVVPFAAGVLPGPLQEFSVFSLILIPLAFAYAITKFRLMDVDLVVRRGAAYTAATAALLGAVYALIFSAGPLTGPWAGRDPAIWVISLVAGALLFHPLRKRMQTVLDRRFYRERYDYRQTLGEFASTLSTETDTDRMLSSVSRRLSQTLGIERMAVLVASRRENGEAGFALAHAAGMAELRGPVRDRVFDLRFFEASLLSGGGKAYIFFENPRDGSGRPAALTDAIAPLGLHYYVPCRARGRVVAYLGLGLTKNGEYLSSEDLSLAGTLSGSLAMALENARLYESLASKADEYQRLKEYSENIVESLSVGICTVGLDDKVESWNTQLELTFGISRAQAVGRELSALLPAKLASELAGLRQESELRTIYKFPLAGADFPEEFQPAGGGNGAGEKESGGGRQERVVNIAVAPLVAKDFKRIGRLIIFDDVTERIELEERLVQADKLSSVGLLAAGVAHEVNTPLAVISSYAQMLRRKAADDSGDAKLLEKITAQSFRASEIVNSLLNFSRLTRRELSPLDLGEVLTETLSLVGPQFREAKIQVRTDLDPEPAPVRGNAGKLQQVFLNLFLNARDAMPEGGTLTIETRYDYDGLGTAPGTGPGTARVTVSDTGRGMTAEQARKVFDPFFTTKGPKHGTGLGLAVTYGIIQEHSGNITVESRPGAGTSFHIELPLAAKPIHV